MSDQELRCVISDLCEQVRDRDAEIELLTKQRDELLRLVKLALKYGEFEQGSGVIHELRNAVEGTKK